MDNLPVDATEVNALGMLIRPRITCADGFSLSVQASRFHYCSPRIDNAVKYTHVEVGFPSERVEALMPYAEDEDDPTGTVYGQVPVEVVWTIINEHGGFVHQLEN